MCACDCLAAPKYRGTAGFHRTRRPPPPSTIPILSPRVLLLFVVELSFLITSSSVKPLKDCLNEPRGTIIKEKKSIHTARPWTMQQWKYNKGEGETSLLLQSKPTVRMDLIHSSRGSKVILVAIGGRVITN